MYANRVIENIETSRVQTLDTLSGSVRSPIGFFIGDCQMKQIPLSRGKFAIVDDKDFEWLNQWKWSLCESTNSPAYANRSIKQNGKWHTISMHRKILGLTRGDGKETDHRNGNGLDNRRGNLRICSHSENVQNCHLIKNKFCKYQGVIKKKTGCWLACIMKNYKNIYLGTHNSAKEAALAYDKKALELYGSDAHINFPKKRPNETIL